MTIPLDEGVVDRVNALGSTPFSGTTFRYAPRRREPLSGEGARRGGGRWNPRGLFPTIYLSIPQSACMGEVERAAAVQHTTAENMLTVPYLLHTVEVQNLPVLDLRSSDALDQVGLSADDIADDDWLACQSVGHAAWFLQVGGLLAPSATGSGWVLAAFETRVEPGQLHVESSEPLTPELYRSLR